MEDRDSDEQTRDLLRELKDKAKWANEQNKREKVEAGLAFIPVRL